MTKVALSLVKDYLSKYLLRAEKEGIVITRHGRPAGILIGLSRKTIGLTTVWRMILGSCAAWSARD